MSLMMINDLVYKSNTMHLGFFFFREGEGVFRKELIVTFPSCGTDKNVLHV